MRKQDYLNKLHSQSLTDDATILAEIRQMVQEAKEERAEKAGKKIKKVVTPYGNYSNSPKKASVSLSASSSSLLTSPKRDLNAPLIGHTLSADGNKRPHHSTEASRNAHSVPAATDNLLRQYAAELRNAKPLPLTKDDLRIKSTKMPYTNTEMKVTSYLDVNKDNVGMVLEPPSSAPSSSSKPAENMFDNSIPNVLGDDFFNELNDNTSKQRLKNVSAKRLSKKYPRFCSNINFNDEDVKKTVPRSDLWISKLLEYCYDEALQRFNTPAPRGKTVYYHGLDMGSLDVFPLLVQRILARKFSTLEIRKTVTLEVLYTIELMIERGEFARFKTKFDETKVKVDSGRGVIFAKFLSEEYDVDILALFLYAREILQDQLGHRLKDVAPNRIWVDGELADKVKTMQPLLTQTVTTVKDPNQDNNNNIANKLNKKKGLKKIKEEDEFTVGTFATEMDSITSSISTNTFLTPASAKPLKRTVDPLPPPSSSSVSASKASYVDKMRKVQEQAEKVVPYHLPAKWFFVEDVVLPEAPVVAFDLTLLAHISFEITPHIQQFERQYLMDRIVEVAVIDLLREGKKEEKKKVLQHISVYSLLRALCFEWKKLTQEDKNTFNDFSNRIYEGLRSLNVVYDNNCAKLRQEEENLREAEAELVIRNGAVMKVEKELKRLEKKWQGGVTTKDEVERLGTLKEELATAKVRRTEQEGFLHRLLASQKKLKGDVENMWDAAMEKLPPFLGEKDKTQGSRKKKKNNAIWVQFTAKMFSKTIEINKSKYEEWKKAMLKSKELAASIAAASKKSSAEERGVDPKELRLAMIQTLARIMTRNVINDGQRKAMLRKHLELQEHYLMLKYNREEYLRREAERQRREQELRLQQLRKQIRMNVITVWTRRLTQDCIAAAQKQAFVVLYDPWWMLDLSIDQLVPPYIQRRVEQQFAHCQRRTKLHQLWTIYRALKTSYTGKQVHNLHRLLESRRCFQHMLHYHHFQLRHKQKLAVLTRFVRGMTYRHRHGVYLQQQQQLWKLALAKHEQSLQTRRVSQFIRFWRKTAVLKVAFRRCQDNIAERNFLRSYYTWKHVHRMQRIRKMQLNEQQLKGCVKIQCLVRVFLAKRRCFYRRVYRTMTRCMQRGLARKRRQQLLATRRLQANDYSNYIQHQHQNNVLKGHLQQWRRQYSLVKGLNLVHKTHFHHLLNKRFRKWVRFATYRTRILTRRVLKMQSAVRMYLAQCRYWKFYRVRRRVIRLQSNWRRYYCRKIFLYLIVYYRHARNIQRHIRGWKLRKQLVQRRIDDIHYAAFHNKYDRLHYYLKKFPSLVTRKDSSGNTALHNAAYGAAKRTLKLLLRYKTFLDINEPNDQGYSPLHLCITSNSAFRDEVFFYMMEHGFDEDMYTTVDEKSCLLLSVEYGRAVIMKKLLADGHDTNIPDTSGLTCLQSACYQGSDAMVRDLLDNEASPHKVGANGSYPIHDSVTGQNIDVLRQLLHHSIDVNVLDGTYYQTALMWAAQVGLADFISELCAFDADMYISDSAGRNVAHYAAMSNHVAVYQSLRHADMDFDSVDLEGNTPLHVACIYGANEFARNLLEGGCYPSFQNHQGNTAAHISAQYNQLDVMKTICEYDTHIGKLNYAHQTPLGVAKFHQSNDVIAFLAHHYRMVDIIDGRNEIGEIWWDKEIDQQISDWDMRVNADGERVYVHLTTGEISRTPPAMSLDKVNKITQQAELPLRRNVVMIKEGDKSTLTKHAYYLEYNQQRDEIADMSHDYDHATTITKYARRKLARMELKRLKLAKQHRKVLTRFIKRHLPGFMVYCHAKKFRYAARIQALSRGYQLRKSFFAPHGDYWPRRIHLAKRRLRYQLWSVYTLYKRRQRFYKMIAIKKSPRSVADWLQIVEKARIPRRTVGVYEEYIYPNTGDIFFYRHAVNGSCSFIKPKKLILFDEQVKVEEDQKKLYGATIEQIELATKLQAMWRGYQIRSYYFFLEKAMDISQHAKERYLNNPEKDSHLYNYALFCFVIQQDIERARGVYLESLRRMQWRGPDIAFVLYSYAIFGLVSGDEDYFDIIPMIQRGKKAEFDRVIYMREKLDRDISNANPPKVVKEKKAEQDSREELYASLSKAIVTDEQAKEEEELRIQLSLPDPSQYRYGKVFELANTGFFRFAANSYQNGMAWMCYAVCRFLVYEDFPQSFDAFMNAFTADPENPNIKRTFDIMMTHFHGSDKRHQDEMVKQRQRHHAQQDADKEEINRILRERARRRQWAARTIQTWFKNRRAFKIFSGFIDNVKKYIKKQVKNASRGESRAESRLDSRAESRDQSRKGSRATVNNKYTPNISQITFESSRNSTPSKNSRY